MADGIACYASSPDGGYGSIIVVATPDSIVMHATFEGWLENQQILIFVDFNYK